MTDIEERDRWARMVAASPDTVRNSAKTWQAALAAFVTLVTTGVVIKGPDTTADLPTVWRVVVTFLVGGGLVLAVLGLWMTVTAEAGTHPKLQKLQDIRAEYGTLTSYEVFLAEQTGRRLARGIVAAGIALIMLIAGIVVSWLAPAASQQDSFLTVTYGRVSTCGIPQASPAGELILAGPDGKETTTIPLTRVTASRPPRSVRKRVPACPHPAFHDRIHARHLDCGCRKPHPPWWELSRQEFAGFRVPAEPWLVPSRMSCLLRQDDLLCCSCGCRKPMPPGDTDDSRRQRGHVAETRNRSRSVTSSGSPAQRRGLLQGAVPVGVVEVFVLAQDGHKVPLVHTRVRSSSSRRQLPIHRSMTAFIRGAWTAVRRILVPAACRRPCRTK